MTRNPIAAWFPWFAWHPVETVDRGWRWGCFVWRRRIAKKPFLEGGGDFWFQHAVAIRTEDDIA